MKTWIFTLPLLCAVNFALAADMGAAPAADKMESASAPVKAGHHHRMHKRTVRKFRAVNLPHGDLRYCLDRKTNKAIIRCSEKRRKR
ncbi:MAG: hypothetical protein WBP86_07560 [Thiobacillaceae bacterium]